jgi:hypothetical protein
MKWSIVPSGSETDPCCCAPPADCCMYRADGFGVDFTEDDLPESVKVTIPAWVEVRPLNQFRGTGILNKDVDGSQLYVSGDVFEYREHSGESWVPVSAVISNYIGELYELTVGGDSFGTSQSECLFWKDGTGSGDGNLTPGDDLVEDQFAGSYEIEIFAPIDYAGVYTVIRRSLCSWSSELDGDEPAGVKLNYYSESFLPMWEIEFDALWGKDGNGNSPVGSYGSGDAEVREL